MFDVSRSVLQEGVTVADLCAVHTRVAESKGELRRLIQGGGVSLNKTRVDSADMIIDPGHLLNNRYLLLQKGKKSYYLIRIV
jgi:tyrosyl-tRNA synthetase